MDDLSAIGRISNDAEEADLNISSLTDESASNKNPEFELESFRKRWRNELQSGSQPLKVTEETTNSGGKCSSLNRKDRNPAAGNNPYSSSTKTNVVHQIRNLTIAEEEDNNSEGFPDDAAAQNKPLNINNSNLNINVDNANNNDNNVDCQRLKQVGEEEKERESRSYYIRGVELERAGQLYQAIQQYKRAIQLVPDIEHKILSSMPDNNSSDSDDDADNDNNSSSNNSVSDDSNSSNHTCLYSKLTFLLSPTAPVCHPKHQQQAVHLSCLPREVLEQVLCWVVGEELDVRSLNAVAGVCRGFFVLTRAETLWKRACQRVWGQNCSLKDNQSSLECSENKSSLYWDSWRLMYLRRPQPRYNGCYISKTSYFRSGECNFHDHTYQPWYIVSYYRYIRFFPGGVVLMLTTSDAPQAVVSHLAEKVPRQGRVMVGKYWLDGATVNLDIRRYPHQKVGGGNNNRGSRNRRRQHCSTDVAETMLQMSFELVSARNGTRNWFLGWKEYNITTLFFSGQSIPNNVDVTQLDTFPQLAFSRVKSYNREATESL